MKQASLIKKINKEIPVAKAVPAEQFYGRPSEGIWLKGSESVDVDGMPIFDYWNIDQQISPRLEKILEKAGWYAEPYDSGTLMIFPA